MKIRFMRFISSILTFCMMMASFFGTGVFAEEIKPDENGNVVISEPITGTVNVDVPGEVNVTIHEGEVDLTVNGIVENGVSASARDAASIDIKANDINRDGDLEPGAGIVVSTDSNEVHVTIEAQDIVSDREGIFVESSGGDVEITSGSIDANGCGIYILNGTFSNEDASGSITVTVNGDMTVHNGIYEVDGEVSEFGPTGIIAEYASSDHSNEIETNIIMNGDIDIESKEEARGIILGTPYNASLEVNGDITVSSGDCAYGVSLEQINDVANENSEGTLTASFNGDINVSGEEVVGLDVFTARNGEVDVSMAGDIVVTGTAVAKEKENAQVIALTAKNYGGEITINMTGNIASSGNGIELKDNTIWKDYFKDDPDQEVPEEIKKLMVDDYEINENELIEGVGGENREYCHEEGDLRIFYDQDGKVFRVDKLSQREIAGTNLVEIVGDVTAEETGVYVDLTNDESAIDVIINGTLTGKTQSVLVSKDTNSEDLTLTVWEIKENDAGNLIERKTENGKTEADQELEKEIQYIIRIDPAQTNIISTAGTTNYKGYDVAHEGDTVIMKLNIPAGYEIDGAYGGADQAVQLLKGADGNYYLVVPRGGGVMLSVKMRKIASANLTRAVVSIDLNGGTLNGKTGRFEMKGWLEKKFKLPGTPTKEGWTFLGWYASEVARTDPEWKAPSEGSSDLFAGDGELELNVNTYVTAVWKEN